MANNYVDSLVNYKSAVKSRWEMGTWTKATEVRLETRKQIQESLRKWKQQNLTNVAVNGKKEGRIRWSPIRLGDV